MCAGVCAHLYVYVAEEEGIEYVQPAMTFHST